MTRLRGWKVPWGDASLSALLAAQGYGDLAPVHQLARSLANMEAVFGQLFPATFVARLVALYLAHGEEKKRQPSE